MAISSLVGIEAHEEARNIKAPQGRAAKKYTYEFKNENGV